MKYFILTLLTSLTLIFSSCDLLEEQTGLTEEEVVKGLKTALEVGADSSTASLMATDGYYGNNLLKILLPPQASQMLEYVSYIEDIAGSGFVENVVKGINRSAENAASEAKPIFVDAITSMSIEDGLNILQGKSTNKTSDFDSIAATNYLKNKTYTNLVGLYAPKIDAALNKVLISTDKGSFTTNQLWTTLIGYYNDAITAAGYTVAGMELLGQTPPQLLKSLSTETQIDESLSLGQFATGKALDGLYYKVGQEEKKIRKDPYQWALDILEKVFGSVYKQ